MFASGGRENDFKIKVKKQKKVLDKAGSIWYYIEAVREGSAKEITSQRKLKKLEKSS